MKQRLLIIMQLIFVVVVTAGCATSRIIPHSQHVIDADLSNTEKLNPLSVLVHIDITDKNQEWKTTQFIEALKRANVFARVDSAEQSGVVYDLVLTKFKHEYPIVDEGFQCFEPMLLVLSLGVIPAICEGEHSLSFDMTVIDSGRTIHFDEKFLKKSMAGWLGVPATVATKGWKFSGNFEEYVAFVFAAHAGEIKGL